MDQRKMKKLSTYVSMVDRTIDNHIFSRYPLISNVLTNLEKVTGIRRHLVIAMVAMLYFGHALFASNIAIHNTMILLPGFYMTMRDVSGLSGVQMDKGRYRHWLTYWIMLSFSSYFDTTEYRLFNYISFYWLAKVALYTYLLEAHDTTKLIHNKLLLTVFNQLFMVGQLISSYQAKYIGKKHKKEANSPPHAAVKKVKSLPRMEPEKPTEMKKEVPETLEFVPPETEIVFRGNQTQEGQPKPVPTVSPVAEHQPQSESLPEEQPACKETVQVKPEQAVTTSSETIEKKQVSQSEVVDSTDNIEGCTMQPPTGPATKDIKDNLMNLMTTEESLNEADVGSSGATEADPAPKEHQDNQEQQQ